MNKNSIALLKGFVCPEDFAVDNRIAVSTVQAKLMQYGYMLDEEAFVAMSRADLSWISNFFEQTTKFLKNAMGGKYNHKPLYKGFPAEVMNKKDVELFFDALKHYWSNGEWVPQSSELEFAPDFAFEKVKYTVLKYADQDTFNKIFTDLVSINTSLMPQDMEIIQWFVMNKQTLVMPDVIPFKENLCTLAAMGIPNLPIKTVTDVLRIAVSLSGGDISLPTVPAAKVKMNRWSNQLSDNPYRAAFKFKKFKRAERKYLLSLLEKTNCDTSEMVLKNERWIRLGEILHPGEYAKQFPKAVKAFADLRSKDVNVRSWYSKLDAAFDKSLDAGLTVLSQRPGEFSRRIDALIRNNPKHVDQIMAAFELATEKTSNKVLFELYGHFAGRDTSRMRTIFVKGARRPVELSTLPALSPGIIESVHSAVFTTLKNKFSTLEPLGNCYIDEELKKIPLPTNMRSMDFSLRPTVRGSRIPFGNADTKVVRAFYHWFDANGSLDPDLSATFVGMGKVQVLAFTGLRVGKSCHSGDIIARRGACAEYVDIDIQDALKSGFRYVVIDVRNYRGGSMRDMQGIFGTMERDHPQSGTSWLPETITGCQEMTSSASVTIASILDLETREYIFMDIDSAGSTFATGDIQGTLKLIQQYASNPKISVYDLVKLHVEARGKQVNLDQEINTHFKFDDFIQSYELTGKLMGV